MKERERRQKTSTLTSFSRRRAEDVNQALRNAYRVHALDPLTEIAVRRVLGPLR